MVLERAVLHPNHRSPLTFAPDHRTTIAVRNLQRFPLDTPYTVIVESIHRLAQKLAASNPMRCRSLTRPASAFRSSMLCARPQPGGA